MDRIEFANKLDPSSKIESIINHFSETMALYNLANNIEDISITAESLTNGITFKLECNDIEDATVIYNNFQKNNSIISYHELYNCESNIEGSIINVNIFK